MAGYTFVSSVDEWLTSEKGARPFTLVAKAGPNADDRSGGPRPTPILAGTHSGTPMARRWMQPVHVLAGFLRTKVRVPK